MENNPSGYKYFLLERSRILNDIQQFLMMVLQYFSDMEDEMGEEQVVTRNGKIKPLIKSLCLIEGLYGYPADNDITGKSY
jgi:hypothetical protein